MKVEKDKKMAETFVALGVEFDLSETTMDDPALVVRNKPGRIEEIEKAIKRHLQVGLMSPAEASQLRGRLVFSNSQTFGRMGALAYNYLGQKVAEGGGAWSMSQDLEWPLEWWLEQVSKAKPRRIPVGKLRRPVYIFSDGSCEPRKDNPSKLEAGYGAVMFDPEDGTLETFGGFIGDPLMELLTDDWTKKQVVGQAELVPCLVAKKIWKRRLRGRLVMHYVDNEAAKYALIKGTSPTRDSAWLVNEFWKSEAHLGSYSWFERVPSACNCADDPSRGVEDVKVGRRRAVRVSLPKILKVT